MVHLKYVRLVRGSLGSLALELPKIFAMIKVVVWDCVTDWGVENVTLMDYKDKDTHKGFDTVLGVTTVEIDPKTCADCRSPRLDWCQCHTAHGRCNRL